MLQEPQAQSLIGGIQLHTILLSALAFRRERLTGKKVAGCLLGFAGVVLINPNWEPRQLISAFSPTAGMILLSALCSAWTPTPESGRRLGYVGDAVVTKVERRKAH